MSPDPPDEAGRQELQRLYREVANNHPDLYSEMVPTNAQLAAFEQQQANLPAGMHPLNARGPLLNNAMNLFAAKFALAMHFERTGNIASASAVVAGRWYSNHQVYIEGIAVSGQNTPVCGRDWPVRIFGNTSE